MIKKHPGRTIPTYQQAVNKQDLGQKCSAWKDFRLTIKILLPLSLRDRVKCDWGLEAVEKPAT